MSRRYYNRVFSIRRLIWSPIILIGGIIYIFYDLEFGITLTAIGAVTTIILIILLINRRREGASLPASQTHTAPIVQSGIQQRIHYQGRRCGAL